MAVKSNIQWTDSTWNIARGCSKVDEDCKFCYMYRDSFNSSRYNPFEVKKTISVFNLPLKIKEPSKIFTSSLTDVFHSGCDAFRNEMWDIIRKCPHHIFQILTKRPERILEHTPVDLLGNSNIWLGTSIGSQQSIKRLYELIHPEINCTKFLSLEPLHGEIILPLEEVIESGKKIKELIDWVIVGGESGNDNGKYKYRPCKLEWIQRIVTDCQHAGIPVFVKQLGTYLSKEIGMSDRHGGNIVEFPELLRVRNFPLKRE